LADAIYYDAAFPAMVAAHYGRTPYRDEYTYFRQCDRLVESMGKRRFHLALSKIGYDEIASRSFEAISRCEREAATLLDKP
jgi:hypothetical protein